MSLDVKYKLTMNQQKKEKTTQVLVGFVYVFDVLPSSHVFKFLWYPCVWVFPLPILTLVQKILAKM